MQEIDSWFVPVDNDIVRRNLNTATDYKFVRPYFRDTRVALDLGCYIGAWTRELARDFDKVYAIDLSEENLECARKNCAEFSNVTYIHAALTDVNTRLAVKYVPDEFRESRIYCVDPPTNSWQTLRYAPSPSDVRYAQPGVLDNLIPKDTPVDFIKSDLQGYDFKALLGGRELITRDHPLIFFENVEKCVKRYNLTMDHIPRWLDNLGAIEFMQMKPNFLWGWLEKSTFNTSDGDYQYVAEVRPASSKRGSGQTEHTA